ATAAACTRSAAPSMTASAHRTAAPGGARAPGPAAPAAVRRPRPPTRAQPTHLTKERGKGTSAGEPLGNALQSAPFNMASPKTILICDDDQGMRDTIAAILKRDYRVLMVASGEAALNLLRGE